MATLVLVTGLPGVGKSTIAKLLVEHAGAFRLNSDSIRRELFPIERTYSDIETVHVIRETEKRAREALKVKKNIVLDALFTTTKSRKLYKKLTQKEGVDFRILYVYTKESLVQERMEKRAVEQKDESEAVFEHYLERKGRYEIPSEPHVKIDNSGSTEDLSSTLGSLVRAGKLGSLSWK